VTQVTSLGDSFEKNTPRSACATKIKSRDVISRTKKLTFGLSVHQTDPFDDPMIGGKRLFASRFD